MFRFFRKERSHGFHDRRTIGTILWSPIAGLINRLSGDADALGSNVPWQRRVYRSVAHAVIFPLFCVWQLLQFIVISWTTTRPLNAFIWGSLPLLLAASIVAMVIIWPFIELRSARRLHREYTVNSEASGEFQAAVLGSKRVQLLTDEPNWRFIHAFTLQRAGLVKNADVLIRGLATFTSEGYSPAHMYLANQYYEEFSKDNSKVEELEKALAHMEQVRSVEPTNLEANIGAGKILQKLGRVDEAMEIFKLSSGNDPEVVPELAKYLIDRGEKEAARFHIQRGLATLRVVAQQHPEDQWVWHTMFKILAVEEDYFRAVDEFKKAFRAVSSPKIKLQLLYNLSNVMMELLKQYEVNDSYDGLRRQMAIVSQAIDFFPYNPAALEKFVDLILYTPNPEFESWLDDTARFEIIPSVFHLLTGVRNAVDGKPEEAQIRFRMAKGGNPIAPGVIAEIAKLLANKKQEPENGILLIDAAIGTWKVPALNFARGEILMTMDRNDEALKELKYASELMTSDPFVFDALARCHDALGNESEAEFARKRANDIRLDQVAMGVEAAGSNAP